MVGENDGSENQGSEYEVAIIGLVRTRVVRKRW